MGFIHCQLCHDFSWMPLCKGCFYLLHSESDVCLHCGQLHLGPCKSTFDAKIEYSTLYLVSTRGAHLIRLWLRQRGWLFDAQIWKIPPRLEIKLKTFQGDVVFFEEKRLKDPARWIGKTLKLPVYQVRQKLVIRKSFHSIIFVTGVHILPSENLALFQKWQHLGIKRIHCFSIASLGIQSQPPDPVISPIQGLELIE